MIANTINVRIAPENLEWSNGDVINDDFICAALQTALQERFQCDTVAVEVGAHQCDEHYLMNGRISDIVRSFVLEDFDWTDESLYGE